MLATTVYVLVPVLFVLLLGYLSWRAKAFDADQVAGINKLTMDFALPATLFVGVTAIPRSQLTQDVRFVLAVLLTLVGLYMVALFVGMKALRLGAGAASLFALGASFPSAPFFGPAVLGGYFGQKSVLAIAPIAIVANLFLMPVTVVLLEVGQRAIAQTVSMANGTYSGTNAASNGNSIPIGAEAVIRDGIFHAVKRPYILAPVAALVLVLLGVRVPSLITSMIELIGRTTSGLSLFVAGLLLSCFSPKLSRVVTVNVILKSAAQPALMLALCGVFSLSRPLASQAVMSMALPAAVITPMLAVRYGTYQAEAGSTMLLTVILMMLVVPGSLLVVR